MPSSPYWYPWAYWPPIPIRRTQPPSSHTPTVLHPTALPSSSNSLQAYTRNNFSWPATPAPNPTPPAYTWAACWAHSSQTSWKTPTAFSTWNRQCNSRGEAQGTEGFRVLWWSPGRGCSAPAALWSGGSPVRGWCCRLGFWRGSARLCVAGLWLGARVRVAQVRTCVWWSGCPHPRTKWLLAVPWAWPRCSSPGLGGYTHNSSCRGCGWSIQVLGSGDATPPRSSPAAMLSAGRTPGSSCLWRFRCRARAASRSPLMCVAFIKYLWHRDQVGSWTVGREWIGDIN